MQYIGIMALLTIISHFVFIALAFVGLQSLRLDRYIGPAQQNSFRLVLVMVAVALGFACSSFFTSFVDNVVHLSYLIYINIVIFGGVTIGKDYCAWRA